ncbi:unnamed protein product, partial [Tetraodon nigroviridis]
QGAGALCVLEGLAGAVWSQVPASGGLSGQPSSRHVCPAGASGRPLHGGDLHQPRHRASVQAAETEEDLPEEKGKDFLRAAQMNMNLATWGRLVMSVLPPCSSLEPLSPPLTVPGSACTPTAPAG